MHCSALDGSLKCVSPKGGHPAAADPALNVDSPELLVDLQEGEEGDVRMSVPLEYSDPILVVVLLVVQRVQHEDRGVDSWQDVREEQEGRRHQSLF